MSDPTPPDEAGSNGSADHAADFQSAVASSTVSVQMTVEDLESVLGLTTPKVAAAIDRALSGQDLSIDDAVTLFDCTGNDMRVLVAAADHLREEQVGDQVAYVVNRNINFTNVCIKGCGFCAFSRDHRTEEGYLLPQEEIIRRAK